MKSSNVVVLFAAILVATPLAALAADNAATATPAGSVARQQGGEARLTEALVRKVDKAANTVTLSHGPLPNGMPGMTMDYRLKDPTWASRLKEGQTVRFATDEVAGVWTVVRLETSGRQ